MIRGSALPRLFFTVRSALQRNRTGASIAYASASARPGSRLAIVAQHVPSGSCRDGAEPRPWTGRQAARSAPCCEGSSARIKGVMKALGRSILAGYEPQRVLKQAHRNASRSLERPGPQAPCTESVCACRDRMVGAAMRRRILEPRYAEYSPHALISTGMVDAKAVRTRARLSAPG